ncbi:MAG: glycosyltransferase family 2 protein [Kineosporiaceae bacterium]
MAAATGGAPGPTSVTVVMASHNRVATTVSCLRALAASAERCRQLSWDVVLVDASSTDGTAETVEALGLPVQVLSVPAATFWARAMRVGMEAAVRSDPDLVIWLNDDVRLHESALGSLLDEWRAGVQALLVGSTCDEVGTGATYGGLRRASRWRPLTFDLVPPPRETPVEVETMNGNFVAIPRVVRRRVGLPREVYRHGMADIDYGLRVRRSGFRVLLLPGFVGNCSRNPVSGTWSDPDLGRLRRLALLRGPKGLPFVPWLYFCLRWGGPLGPAIAVKPYLRAMTARGLRRHRGARLG